MLISSFERGLWGVQEEGFDHRDAVIRDQNHGDTPVCIRNGRGLKGLAEKIIHTVALQHSATSIFFGGSPVSSNRLIQFATVLSRLPSADNVQVDMTRDQWMVVQPKLESSYEEVDGTMHRTYRNGVSEFFTIIKDNYGGSRFFPSGAKEEGIFSRVDGTLIHGYRINEVGPITFRDPIPVVSFFRTETLRRLICEIDGILAVVDERFDWDNTGNLCLQYEASSASLEEALLDTSVQPDPGEGQSIREVLTQWSFEEHVNPFINLTLSSDASGTPRLFRFSHRATADFLEMAFKIRSFDIRSLIDPASGRNLLIEAAPEGASVFLSTDIDAAAVCPSLKQAILGAKRSVLMFAYSLFDFRIICALKSVAEKGLPVTVVYDPEISPNVRSQLGDKVIHYPRNDFGPMHNKLLVIDSALVWVGSANMTPGSFSQDGNLDIGLNSAPLANAVQQLALALINHTPLAVPPQTLDYAGSRWTFYFHPYHGNESSRELFSRIEKASKRIFVAMFTFTDKGLVAALSRAKRRGVDVRVIMDGTQKSLNYEAFIRLKRGEIPCGYRIKNGLLHYKAALIDDMLVAGSCNWTKAGFFKNYETMFCVDPVPQCHKEWIERWRTAVEKGSSYN
jgi:cardiolipin synthase